METEVAPLAALHAIFNTEQSPHEGMEVGLQLGGNNIPDIVHKFVGNVHQPAAILDGETKDGIHPENGFPINEKMLNTVCKGKFGIVPEIELDCKNLI